MTHQTCRVLIADDHAIIRAGLRALLTSSANHEVVGEAADGNEAILMVNELAPQVLLIDLSMPRMNGTEAIQVIRDRHPNLKIIALTVHRTEEYVRAALDAGANGYMLKDDTHQELLNSIQSVLKGQTYLSPAICGHVVNSYLDPQGNVCKATSWDSLTLREREVIKLIAEGNTNKMIARMLSISVKTVEKHRGNMMKKLDLHSASKITAYAIENRLV